MPRPALYSSSRPARRPLDGAAAAPSDRSSSASVDSAAPGALPQGDDGASATIPPTPAASAVAPSRRHLHSLWAVIALLSALLAASLGLHQRPAPHRITQEDIDAAVLRTLETTTRTTDGAMASTARAAAEGGVVVSSVRSTAASMSSWVILCGAGRW